MPRATMTPSQDRGFTGRSARPSWRRTPLTAPSELAECRGTTSPRMTSLSAGSFARPGAYNVGVEAVVSRHPLRPAALALLGRVPRAMDLLIGVTGDTTPARALLRPGLWADLVKPGRSIG